jgi:hypothetical protein
MPCGNFFYCAMCHNLRPSLTIIMNDGDQYFEKKIFMSKFFHSTMCQILIDGWQSITSAWNHGCNYNGVA